MWRTYFNLITISCLLLNQAIAEIPVLSSKNARILAKDCTGCHGFNGVSQGTVIPNIAGANQAFLFNSMKKYQSGEYISTVMQAVAKGYTDNELKKIAHYFAKMPAPKAHQSFQQKWVNNGQKLHHKYCQKCHSSTADINDDKASQLAGQWSDYLRFSFADIKAGKREIPRKMEKRLQRLFARHGTQAIEALLAYYASQQ